MFVDMYDYNTFTFMYKYMYITSCVLSIFFVPCALVLILICTNTHGAKAPVPIAPEISKTKDPPAEPSLKEPQPLSNLGSCRWFGVPSFP